MTPSEGAAQLLRLMHASEPRTRSDVSDLTGWARMTVNGRVDELLERGLLEEIAPMPGTRGRPAAQFRFNKDAGELLVADTGASGGRFARCDLEARVLDHSEMTMAVDSGPDEVLGAIIEGLSALRTDRPLWGVGISVPGPVEFSTGRIVSPPIMTGWDELAPADVLGPAFGAPVLVENDVNAMAWGEKRHLGADRGDDLLFVKVGTGIGAGIITHGQVMRGAQGAAGDLGHTWAPRDDWMGEPPLCRCGKLGCLEAYASGWAIARDLTLDGEPAADVADVLRLYAAGNNHAIRRIRDAGRVLGRSLAPAVSLLNPSELVIGGQLATAGEHLLSGVREHVAAHSLPLATRQLTIRVSTLAQNAGVIGLADALARFVLSPEHLGGVLDRVESATSAPA